MVGPDVGHGICRMYRDVRPYTVVPAPRIYRFPEYWRDVERLADAVTGDVVIAVKAYADTLPVALRLRKRRAARVVAYLDEWDGALMAARSISARAGRWLRHAHHPLDECYAPLVERLLPRCDLVLGTTTFLQRKFGGNVLPMGVDTECFAPLPGDQRMQLRRELGLDGLRLIVFGGVVRPHKGIELILDALRLLGRNDVRLVIVGPDKGHVESLLRTPAYAPFLIALGPRPKSEMPRYLDLADLAVLPLNDSLLARSQMPCKVFEAMAMAKPIVASTVSDLPIVLDGCGSLVPSGDAGALATAIGDILNNPDRARRMGEAAREKCLREYSATVLRVRLQTWVNGLLARRTGEGV